MTPLDELIAHTRVAYFSMEIAIRPEIPTYSGGLGILAGDTMRSCADLNLPVIFVSLACRQGYLRQEIDPEGRQIDHPDPWDPAEWCMPLSAMIAVQLNGRDVWIRPWLYVHTGATGDDVGVLLLDTDLEQNTPEDRGLTDRLYGGDEEYRLRQEAVLGIGGVRLLQALGFNIETFHMNEGHAALLTLELLKRHRRPRGRTPQEESPYNAGQVRDQCVFTTHTPVEAGHDKFPYDMVMRVLDGFMETAELRRYGGEDRFNMTHLALKLSGFVNGVARRHAETTTGMFPGYQVHAITNGIHVPTWAHPAFVELFNKIDPHWAFEPVQLLRVEQLPDETIRKTHRKAKDDLIDFIARQTGIRMDPAVPLIGFARRMTGYKRPELLFSDIERLKAIHRQYPFQLVFGGKAHPKDTAGKEAIQHLCAHVHELADEIPIAFLENYDFSVARPLVAGVDLWLNTPLPPMEASGTSGMKAAINGALNLSVLDGWWLEGYVPGVTGWAIGGDDQKPGDDAAQLYDQLQTAVLPLYYDNPERWTWMMKQTIAKIGTYFNSQRMMRRYASEAYLR